MSDNVGRGHVLLVQRARHGHHGRTQLQHQGLIGRRHARKLLQRHRRTWTLAGTRIQAAALLQRDKRHLQHVSDQRSSKTNSRNKKKFLSQFSRYSVQKSSIARCDPLVQLSKKRIHHPAHQIVPSSHKSTRSAAKSQPLTNSFFFFASLTWKMAFPRQVAQTPAQGDLAVEDPELHVHTRCLCLV
jgi:hypothetical protein